MATFKIVQIKEKVDKNGLAPLVLRITVNRKLKRVFLNQKVSPKHWDAEGEKVKRGHPNSTRVNQYLVHKKSEAMNAARDLEIQEGRISPDKVKAAVKGESSISFLEYAEGYLNRLLVADKIGSYDKAKAVVSKVTQYLKSKDLMLDEVTVNWLRGYETYLRVIKKNSTNTIHSNMKVIRAILNQAIDEDLLKYANHPFHKYKLKWEKVEKIFLTEDEINRLDELDLQPGSNLRLHRDMFIFACYVGGIRISDIIRLRHKNFSGTHVRIVAQKTNDAVTVMVPNKGLEIISAYSDKTVTAEEFMFPVLNSDFNILDAMGKFKMISSKTAQINSSLKILADMAGIEKTISTHIARHTFATRALMIGIEVENLAKLMGHKKISQTLEYAKIVNEVLDNDMSKFNDM